MTEAQRATLRIGADCSNRCVFCAQDGVALDPFELSPKLGVLRASASELTLTGGEPLLVPELAAIVRAARDAGFEAVGVQTNGARLGEPGVAAALRDAGLTDVHVSLHGAEASVHEYHTGTPGSFAALLSGIDAAHRVGLTLAATTVITRSSYRTLAALPPLLAARGVRAWLALLARAEGRAALAFDRVMPRLGLALPFALHALTEARRLGLSAWLQGAPLCLLGPLTDFALPGPERAYAEPCGSCDARPACPGVDPAYLVRFGGDELRARPASTTTPASRLARLFVGVGPAAPAAPPAPAPRVERSLPMLGKVRPALKEVARGSERRSGDALREILPGLFEGGEKP
ncbi:MAG TPA: radical SAM protein [Polyangiaceae bacterium]